jgi:hypothetical protein
MRPLRPQLGRLLRGGVAYIVRRPRVKYLARLILDHIPALQTQFHAWMHHAEVAPPRRYHVPLDKNDLSPDMQAVFDELNRYTKTTKH